MAMPIFTPGDDPGSNFPELLRRIGGGATAPTVGADALGAVPHATTCVAMRYADGVAMAGAAGPAMEMVRLFQLQLEHYEKVEGTSLSLEGKANQLSMMIRGNLQSAMMGMGVVPIFAGYDLRL